MRAVYRNKKYNAMINALVGEIGKDSDTNTAPFDTKKSVQCYAAMLGFEKGVRQEFSRKSEDVEAIKWDTFNWEWHSQYIYLIALAEIGDIAILKGKTDDAKDGDKNLSYDDMIRIFEEYAEGGFQIMQEWFDKKPGDIYGAEAIIQGLKREGLLKKPRIEEQFDDPDF